MFKKEILRGNCIDLSFEGKGVVNTNKGIIFVDNCFINEEVELETLYQRNGQLFGHITKLVVKSSDRINPKCKVCASCGGCQFQQLSYQVQLKYKTNKVKEAFKRNMNVSFDVLDTIGMSNPYNYRNKCVSPVGVDKYNNVISGFYKANTHQIIKNDNCVINDNRANEVVNKIVNLMNELKIKPYDENSKDGCIRHIVIRTSYHYDEIMLTLVSNTYDFDNKELLFKRIITEIPTITSFIYNVNSKDTNIILGDYQEVIYGNKYLKDKILDINFNISSKSFYQVNPIQVEKLYQTAIDLADLSNDQIVIDTYCGIGSISLNLAKYVKQVYGVEIVKDAIDDAKMNAKNNNINNVIFECDDASNYLINFNKKNIKVDTIFVDPPRKGLDDKFVQALLELKPNKIIYISCGVESLTKDCLKLSSLYKIKTIQPVDMFPFTHHVETVCLLIRNK